MHSAMVPTGFTIHTHHLRHAQILNPIDTNPATIAIQLNRIIQPVLLIINPITHLHGLLAAHYQPR